MLFTNLEILELERCDMKMNLPHIREEMRVSKRWINESFSELE